MTDQAVESMAAETLQPGNNTDTAQDTLITVTSNSNTQVDSADSDYISKYTFEDYYLDAFIATDKKSESYEKACIATDYDVPKYLKQYAYSYHKGLEAKGIIEKALQKATLSDRIASRMKLNELRESAKSETVQLAAAKHTSGDMYTTESTAQGIEVHVNRDSVSITHKNQTLTIETENKE